MACNNMQTFIIYIAMLGCMIGLLSGFFGIGGGVLIVPIIASYYDFQLAVCISLGVMVLNSIVTIASKFSHMSVSRSWIMQLLPGMILGIISGTLLHSHLSANFLKLVLYIILIIIGIQLFFIDRKPEKTSAKPRYTSIYGYVLGLLSGTLGIGIGSFCLPYLIHHRVKVQQASAIISVCTLVVSIIGFTWITTQLHQFSTTDTQLFWPILLILSISSCIVSPIASRLSRNMDTLFLQKIFAIILIAFGIGMLIDFF